MEYNCVIGRVRDERYDNIVHPRSPYFAMGLTKRVITLRQASKISGYNQDYLGSLIRNGEIKGVKVGRNWCTTEAEIKSYLFRQKIKKNQLAITDFFSKRRIVTISALTIFLLCVGTFAFYILSYSSNPEVQVQKNLSDNNESLL